MTESIFGDEEEENPLEGYKEKVMATFTAAQIEAHGNKILDEFEDGFQWSDIIYVVPQVMEIVESVQGMSGEEKRESAEAILDYVIDNTNVPWLPDSLVDPILKKGVRFLIPVIIKATKGGYDINS